MKSVNRTMQAAIVAVFAFIFALTLVGPLQAQGTSEIVGAITDSTQASVAGAEITIRSEETGVVRIANSNDSGQYAVPYLPSGRYSVMVRKAGFKPVTRTSIPLRIDQSARIDIALEVGGVNESVTVEGSAPLLESESSTVGQVIDNKTILDLPLNGRSYMQLGSLSAGAIPNKLSKDATFAVNGNRGTQNAFILDGVNNMSFLRGLDNRQRDAVRPSVDAIAEFKVLTATFSAQYGQAAGAVVLATVKSGGNELHGTAYEFLRNQKMDALPFFQPAGTPVPLYIRNQYGVSAGGPIRKNRLFVFGSWERTSVRNESPQNATVPTAAMRQGNFGGMAQIFDPATLHVDSAGRQVRDPFPNNIIPANRFHPVTGPLADRWPQPNIAPRGAVNFSYNPRQTDDTNRFDGRTDFNLKPGQNLFVRGSISRDGIYLVKNLPAPAISPGKRDIDSIGIGAGYTVALRPNLLNEFRYGYSWVQVAENGLTPRDELGIKGSLAPEINSSNPNIRVTGVAALTPGNVPLSKDSLVVEFLDGLSWQRGAHGLKFGGSFQIVHPNSLAALSGRGGVNFEGVFTQSPIDRARTGVPYADFLLGLANTGSAGTVTKGRERSRRYSFYGQDDWRVSRTLTLNLGLRYELTAPFWDADDRMSAFVLERNDPAFGTLIKAGTAGRSRSLIDRDNNNFAPRLGFAWQAAKNWVVRGGAGIFYGQDEASGISQRLLSNPPWVYNVSFPSDQLTIGSALDLNKGFPVEAISSGNVPNPSLIAWPRDTRTAYVSQWTLNVQHTLPGDIVVQAAYIGSTGNKLIGNRQSNQPVPGPGAVNPRRPFPQYGGITVEEDRVRSSYEGLNLQAEKRYSKGISLLTAFTYGHIIDTMSGEAPGETDGGIAVNAQDPRNINAEKASADWDVRYRFTNSLIYELPFGKQGSALGKGAVGHVIRGWAVNSIATMQTGSPYTPGLSFDPTNTGNAVRPDRLRDGNLPSSERTLLRFFDVGAFVAPAAYTFGTAGRNILVGPGRVNFDFGIFRRFSIRERQKIEFRGELFNGFNTPQFGTPNRTIGTPQAGQITSADSMRQVQLALKLVF